MNESEKFLTIKGVAAYDHGQPPSAWPNNLLLENKLIFAQLS
jgi:hypothetical protein